MIDEALDEATLDRRLSIVQPKDDPINGCSIVPGEYLGYLVDNHWAIERCVGWRRDQVTGNAMVKFDPYRVGLITEIPLSDVYRLRDERDDKIDQLHALLANLKRESKTPLNP